MRVNVYAEEMTDRIEIVAKEIDGHRFTGLRFYLELPATEMIPGPTGPDHGLVQHRGPFIHRRGDDDSAAVTFWGKRDLREVLRKALDMLDAHYAARPESNQSPGSPHKDDLAKHEREIADVMERQKDRLREKFAARPEGGGERAHVHGAHGGACGCPCNICFAREPGMEGA